MRYLARREHSRAELRSKLLPHVQEGEDVEAVLDDLARRNWLSDSRAAEQMVTQRRSRYGSQRIAYELRQKGIGEELIAGTLPQLKATELEAAHEVWARKFGQPAQDQKERARQARFLQSRGFAMDIILRVLKNAAADAAEGDG